MTGSIRGRLLLLAAVWLGAALLAAFLFISSLLEDFVTDRFDAEAAAVADGLIASVEIDDGGRIELDEQRAICGHRLDHAGQGRLRQRRVERFRQRYGGGR